MWWEDRSRKSKDRTDVDTFITSITLCLSVRPCFSICGRFFHRVFGLRSSGFPMSRGGGVDGDYVRYPELENPLLL